MGASVSEWFILYNLRMINYDMLNYSVAFLYGVAILQLLVE